ncbi:cop9 signalosome complex subunit 6-like protein, partial [Lasius niger]
MEVDVPTDNTNEQTPMEIDEDTSERNPKVSGSVKVMASSGTVGSVSISLHPLVIMNVSEHWTRLRAQEGSDQLVYGALIGKQKGRNIEIMNSFELLFTCIGDDVIIDRDYYNTKEEQFKLVFSEMDFLGWYTTVIDLVNGEATMLFVPLTYTLATEEAERIGVDHVQRMCNNEQGECSVVAEHLTAQHSAIKMLHARVKLVLRYVQAVESGELKGNHEVLRAACSLSHRLP